MVRNSLAVLFQTFRFRRDFLTFGMVVIRKRAKAYEMMSCYDGLLELYRITGEPSYLKSVEMAVRNIIESEINIAGSGTAYECFYHGTKYQTEPTYHTMETCVTMTWMKLCFNL